MIHLSTPRSLLICGTALALLAGCSQPIDFDLRGLGGGFSTAEAAQSGTAPRPEPDARGVISYPNYQVVVAQRDETIDQIAARLNISAQDLARFNGLQSDVPLRQGEVIALPGDAVPGAGVDITSLADGAISRAAPSSGVQTQTLPPAAPAQTTAPAPQIQQPAQAATQNTQATDTPIEPVRHKVQRGETAFIISRLYNVTLKSLAEWNGLGPDFAIREGQYLLIPVPNQSPPTQSGTAATTRKPGTGSAAPTPPSASTPLPQETAAPAPAEPSAPVADLGPTSSSASMVYPVRGSIVRAYAKGRNDGIDIKAAPGASVKAADQGTVAAITKSAEGIPIIVIRHDQNLLTVYANVADVTVQKGDTVARGQAVAKLRSGDDAFLHFEVRNGFESVDPLPYLQ